MVVLDPIEEAETEDIEQGSFNEQEAVEAASLLEPQKKVCCSFLICFLISLIVSIIALLFYGIWRIIIQMKA